MTCMQTLNFPDVAKIIDLKTEKVVGEILTLLEASISNEKQVEALKSTMKRYLWTSNRDTKIELERQLNINA